MKKRTYIKNKTAVISIILVLFVHIICYSQFKKLSGLHDSMDITVVDFLDKSGFGKVTIYYDDLNKKEGLWKIYPSIKISNNMILLNVSTIKGIESKNYNFIILLDNLSKEIIDTIGPFYESYVDAIDYKIIKNKIDLLIVRLSNPPEAEEPRFTIVEYKRKLLRLEKIKTYDKD
jgi:hypothetical protein